jgi:hypothetical protein
MYDEDDIAEKVTPSLLKSGFPFQLAIAQRFETIPDWTLVVQEFAWRDRDTDRFLDMVVTGNMIVATI